MIIKEELQKVAPQVMQRLLDLGAVFPEKGVVAGQAVASMFWEELGLDLRGPINDIDVFATAHDFESAGLGRQKPFRRSLPTAKIGNKIEQDSDVYDGVPFIAQRHEIRVLSTYTEGLMNYTSVSAVDNISASQKSQIIVDGFDLNLVGIGIDLETKSVVCSQGFLEFCHHKKIQAQTCFTPAHTLIRLAKKYYGQEIEGASCDYDQQRNMLECAIMTQSNNGELDQSVPSEFAMLRFGKRYKELAQKYQSHLPKLQSYKWKKTEKYSIELHQFVCAKRTNDIEVALIQGQEVLSPSAYRFMITQKFPKIHQLLHSNDYEKKLEILKAFSVIGNTADQSTKEQEWFLALQLHLCPQSIGSDLQVTHPINHIRLALGQPSMAHNLDNMTVLESMKIFNDEAIVSNMEHVQHVCDVFNSNVSFWKMMTEHFDITAQDLLTWSSDKNAWSKKILISYDYADTIESISMKADSCRQDNKKLLAKTLLDAIIFYKDDESFIKNITEQ